MRGGEEDKNRGMPKSRRVLKGTKERRGDIRRALQAAIVRPKLAKSDKKQGNMVSKVVGSRSLTNTNGANQWWGQGGNTKRGSYFKRTRVRQERSDLAGACGFGAAIVFGEAARDNTRGNSGRAKRGLKRWKRLGSHPIGVRVSGKKGEIEEGRKGGVIGTKPFHLLSIRLNLKSCQSKGKN